MGQGFSLPITPLVVLPRVRYRSVTVRSHRPVPPTHGTDHFGQRGLCLVLQHCPRFTSASETQTGLFPHKGLLNNAHAPGDHPRSGHRPALPDRSPVPRREGVSECRRSSPVTMPPDRLAHINFQRQGPSPRAGPVSGRLLHAVQRVFNCKTRQEKDSDGVCTLLRNVEKAPSREAQSLLWNRTSMRQSGFIGIRICRHLVSLLCGYDWRL